MRKTIPQLRLFFIFSCLIADLSFTCSLPQGHFVGSPALIQAGFLNEQALLAALQEFKQPLVFDRFVHHDQSDLRHRLAIAGTNRTQFFSLPKMAGESDNETSFKAIEKKLRERILSIADEEGANQRLAVPLQKVVQEFAEQMRKGRGLSPRQYAYGKVLVETHDQEVAQFDASRHDTTVARMIHSESAEGWDRLSSSEQHFFLSLLATATGSNKHLLTRAQLDYAERYLRAIDERQKFHAFLDEQMFGHTLMPTRDQIPDFLTIFDALLRDTWAGSRERKRLLESIPTLFQNEQTAWDDQFLVYVHEWSPLRDDTPYGSDYSYEETLLVRQLLRTATRRPEAMDFLTNALLHQQGFRLISPTSVFAVLHALVRQHRKNPLSDKVLTRLRHASTLARLYHWWRSATFPKDIQRLIVPPTPPTRNAPLNEKNAHDVLAVRRQIVAEIRNAWNEQVLPTERWASDHFPTLAASALEKEIFGGWRAALIAAGVPSPLATQLCQRGPPEYSREEVTHWAARFPDRHLRFGFLITERSKWFYAALFHFDSLDAALDSAHRPGVTLPPLVESQYSEPLNFEGRWNQVKTQLDRLYREQEQLSRYNHRIIQQALDLRTEINALATLYRFNPAIAPQTIRLAFKEELEANKKSVDDLFNQQISQAVQSIGSHIIRGNLNLPAATYRKRIESWFQNNVKLTTPADWILLNQSISTYLTSQNKEPKLHKQTGLRRKVTPPALLQYVSFKESVYDQLPWPERIEDHMGGRLFVKRVTVPGVDMRVIYSEEGSWSIVIAPGWHWALKNQLLSDLLLSWDAKTMTLTRIRKPFEDLRIILQRAPKILLRFSVKKQAIHNGVTLILEDRSEFQKSGINAQGITGSNTTDQLEWNLHRVKPENLSTLRSSASLDFLSPFASLERALVTKIDQPSFSNAGQFYDSQRRQIALIDLLRKLKGAWSTVDKWLEKHYGLNIRLTRNLQDQSVRLEFVAYGQNAQVVAMRRKQLPLLAKSV